MKKKGNCYVIWSLSLLTDELCLWKMMKRKAFLLKPKHQCHLSQWGEWANGAQLWKERRLLYESTFIAIDKWILTLKMVDREAFLMKPKHQCHLSLSGE